MDFAGRLVIPKKIRQEANRKAGLPLEIEWREGRIEIEPVPLAVRLLRKGRLLIAVPTGNPEPLTSETVEWTRESLSSERSKKPGR
ncbi:MAG: AbrB/MazE/SpoVT family DNA-binding domain-containing protein [Terriglobia bacterium]